jgi:hypothetical protein
MLEKEIQVTLSDGSNVLIRPVKVEDADKMVVFLKNFRPIDLRYIHFTKADKTVIAQQLTKPEPMIIDRVVAERNGTIIAEATLEYLRHGWLRRSGEVSLMVDHEFKDSEVPGLVAKEIFFLAARKGFDRLLTRCMVTQTEIIDIFKRLHFTAEATLKNHVVDDDGVRRDLVLMTLDISNLWNEIQNMISDSFPSMESLL